MGILKSDSLFYVQHELPCAKVAVLIRTILSDKKILRKFLYSAVAGQIETRTSPVPSRTFSQKHIELTTTGYVIM